MSTPTPRNRLELQDFRANNNTWGVDHLNPNFQFIDDALDGVVTIDVGDHPSNEYTIEEEEGFEQDEARMRTVRVIGTGAGGTFEISVPETEKWRWIVNDSNMVVIIVSDGGTGTGDSIPQNSVGVAHTDGSNTDVHVSVSGVPNAPLYVVGSQTVTFGAEALGREILVGFMPSPVNVVINLDLTPEEVNLGGRIRITPVYIDPVAGVDSLVVNADTFSGRNTATLNLNAQSFVEYVALAGFGSNQFEISSRLNVTFS